MIQESVPDVDDDGDDDVIENMIMAQKDDGNVDAEWDGVEDLLDTATPDKDTKADASVEESKTIVT